MATGEVLIVGGGITGVAAALALAERGVGVRLIERDRLAAMGSGWTLGGVRQSGRDPAELPLARAAVARWAELDARLGGRPGYRRRGNLRLARDEAEVETIRALAATQAAAGLDIALLDGEAARRIAPALSRDILAASFCRDDGHADPIAAVTALADEAQRLGAQIESGVAATALTTRGGAVTGVETNAGRREADCVVLACGLHAPALLAPLGLDLPIAARIVLVLQTTPAPPLFEQVFGVANADCAGRQEIDGRLRVTTGVSDWKGDATGWTADSIQPRARDVATLIARAGAILPALHEARVARVWGGLIDLTPDGLPALDAPCPGLVVASGFSGHGFGIGPVSGEIVADLVTGAASPFDLAPFRLARFSTARGPAAPLTLHG
ncbi:MAG: FAD-binding oxidoreductase [Methylobacteriaceae bacterium]|nr:FAD-binding oxidoreductase [Methylobacteriaceae bacterium]